MHNRPCDVGQVFKLKDGRHAEIYMVHKPSRGYGVTYTIERWDDGVLAEDIKHYMPWHKFKKLVAAESLHGRTS